MDIFRFGAWYWTGYVGTWSFIAVYCAYVFFSIIGVMQFIATKWNLKGISFFPNKKWGYAFSVIAITCPAAWFFTSYDCTGLTFDAPVQLFWIAICTIFGFLCTFTIAHIIHRDMRLPKEKNDVPGGIDILKETTYWRAISLLSKRKPQ